MALGLGHDAETDHVQEIDVVGSRVVADADVAGVESSVRAEAKTETTQVEIKRGRD